MKSGDLVRIIKGYKLTPSPQTGDIGLIISMDDNTKALDTQTCTVYITKKILSLWVVNCKQLEVISEQ